MKNAVIYGATGTGRNVYKNICSEYDVRYFIDRNNEMIGTEVEGKQVKSIDCADLNNMVLQKI